MPVAGDHRAAHHVADDQRGDDQAEHAEDRHQRQVGVGARGEGLLEHQVGLPAGDGVLRQALGGVGERGGQLLLGGRVGEAVEHLPAGGVQGGGLLGGDPAAGGLAHVGGEADDGELEPGAGGERRAEVPRRGAPRGGDDHLAGCGGPAARQQVHPVHRRGHRVGPADQGERAGRVADPVGGDGHHGLVEGPGGRLDARSVGGGGQLLRRGLGRVEEGGDVRAVLGLEGGVERGPGGADHREGEQHGRGGAEDDQADHDGLHPAALHGRPGGTPDGSTAPLDGSLASLAHDCVSSIRSRATLPSATSPAGWRSGWPGWGRG